MNIFKKKVESIKYKEGGNYLSFPQKRESCPISKYKTPASAGVTDSLSTSSGFTLVETLVAITILMIAIAGPLTVAEKGLSASIYARDQLIASYLAQDEMEYIKNVLDTNQLTSSSFNQYANWWLNFSGVTLDTCTNTSPCGIDTTSPYDVDNSKMTPDCVNDPDTGLNPCQLNLDSNGYDYNSYNSSPNEYESNFTRYFYLIPFNTDGTTCSNDCNAASVIVNVTWPGDTVGGGGVTLEDTFFNVPIP